MKNFPHQFNDTNKLYSALAIVNELSRNHVPLTDENFGEQLTRHHIYTYRDKSLSIDKFLDLERQKPASNRGYLTVSRDIRRFFELLGFITVFPDKTVKLSSAANQLLRTSSNEIRKGLWKNALLQLGLEGTDGEISHPYRILLKLVNRFPGIETTKLMLALEAENDSDEEFERIIYLSQQSLEQIIIETGTTMSMAANAIKILPGIAEQIDDIQRLSNKAYPIGQLIITEDEITTEEELTHSPKKVADFRKTSANEIAKNPNLTVITSVSIDLGEAIKIRQRRLVEHQEIVRSLALLNEKYQFKLFDGKFDCLAVKAESALLYEIKTIIQSKSDEEKQTVKGVGQLKYYKYSIVNKKMGFSKIKEILVFSQKPELGIIEFCDSENILVVWKNVEDFHIFNFKKGIEQTFNPTDFL